MMKKSFFLVVAVCFSFTLFAQDAKELIGKANDAMQAKNYAGAFELYEKAMANLGNVQVNKSIYYNIALAAMQAEKNEAALGYFDKAIEASGDTSAHINVVKCYQYKGSVYNKMKDLPNALLSYEKALAASDDKPGVLYMNAGVTAFNLNNNEKALSYFDSAYTSGYKPEDALSFKAMVYKKMNNDSAYMQTMLLGNEKFPDNKKFSSALAGVYVGQGNTIYKGAVEMLNATNKKVNDKKLKTTDAAYKTEIDSAKAEFAKAVEVLSKALKFDPSNANALKLVDACKQHAK